MGQREKHAELGLRLSYQFVHIRNLFRIYLVKRNTPLNFLEVIYYEIVCIVLTKLYFFDRK